jgi:hypothetical protein
MNTRRTKKPASNKIETGFELKTYECYCLIILKVSVVAPWRAITKYIPTG